MKTGVILQKQKLSTDGKGIPADDDANIQVLM